MPRFFFDFTSGRTIEADDIGTEFPSLEEAYLDAVGGRQEDAA